jgi:hypothetical protein
MIAIGVRRGKTAGNQTQYIIGTIGNTMESIRQQLENPLPIPTLPLEPSLISSGRV